MSKSFIFGSMVSFLIVSMMAFPAWGQTQNANPAQPGSINYVEGQSALDGQTLSSSSVGSTVLSNGHTLTTQTGKVEILLTPGVFLRVGNNSAIKMITAGLADTEVEIDRGESMVEVTDISKNNNIRVDVHGGSANLLNKGLYDFDADNNQIRVMKGKASIRDNNQRINLGDHHEVSLNASGKLKSQNFDTKQYADDLYRWSGLRSGYLAEAGADTAQLYVNGGAGWNGTGWYWDPAFDSYTFIPGDGIFYSPFGWGFYSPFAIYGSPFFYGGYGGYYGRSHPFNEIHGPYGHGFEPRGGFHGMGGGGLRGGGGFHGGGGGFHGGGGGGGGRR